MLIYETEMRLIRPLSSTLPIFTLIYNTGCYLQTAGFKSWSQFNTLKADGLNCILDSLY